jgi:hypothetical protein
LCVKAQFLRRYPSLAVAVNNANQRDLTGAKRGNGGTWGHPKLAVFFDALANSVKSTDLIESQRGRNCDVIRDILVMLEELGEVHPVLDASTLIPAIESRRSIWRL